MIEVCSQHCDRTGYYFDSTIEVEHCNENRKYLQDEIFAELKFSNLAQIGQI